MMLLRKAALLAIALIAPCTVKATHHPTPRYDYDPRDLESNTTCVDRSDNGTLISQLDGAARCATYRSFHSEFLNNCTDIRDYAPDICPCESLCIEYNSTRDFRWTFCAELVVGCKRACRRVLRLCCDYPSLCGY